MTGNADPASRTGGWQSLPILRGSTRGRRPILLDIASHSRSTAESAPVAVGDKFQYHRIAGRCPANFAPEGFGRRCSPNVAD